MIKEVLLSVIFVVKKIDLNFTIKDDLEAYLEAEGMKELQILRDRVRESRKEVNNQYSCQDQYDINELLNSIIKTSFFENDYLNQSNKLLLEDMTYDEAIEKGIKKVIEIGLFN